MMDDQFLRDLKKQPSPEFAARLRATLRSLPPSAVARVAPAAGLRKWLAAAASIAVVAFAFTLPPVQVAAQAFLNLFRVTQFTGVEVDVERFRALESSGFDPSLLIGSLQLDVSGASEQVSYATTADAGAAAGIDVLTPAWLPPGFASAEIVGTPEVTATVALKTAGLQALLDTLGLADVELPVDLDGEPVTVHVSPIVTQRFASGESSIHVVQARSPEVRFPAGVDLSQLAYAALRVLGMSREQAYHMAVTIDWRSTLIVPVPAQAVAYRPVNVSGNEGLLIEARVRRPDGPGSVLMWSAGGRSFAVTGHLNGAQLLEIAQSLQ
jgi:hypothetical protein